MVVLDAAEVTPGTTPTPIIGPNDLDPAEFLNHHSFPTQDGNFVFIQDEFLDANGDEPVQMWDISNPASPSYVDRLELGYDVPVNPAHNLEIRYDIDPDRLYVAWYQLGLRAWDFTTSEPTPGFVRPNSEPETSVLHHKPQVGGGVYEGTWGVRLDPITVGGETSVYVFQSDRGFGLVVDCLDEDGDEACDLFSGNNVDNPPSVTLTNPVNGDTVSGVVSVTADASDDNDVTQVEFFVNGASIGVDNFGPGWSATWNTESGSYPDGGGYIVKATATDTAFQTASDSVTVSVNNVDDPPGVTLTNPGDGNTVSGLVSVTADASDDSGVTKVEFFIDDALINTDTDGGNGWSFNWDTTAYSNEDHSVEAVATDTGGLIDTDSVVVTVDNSAPSTVHVGDLDDDSSLAGQGGKWNATVTVTVHDASDNLVATATVSGSWSAGANGSGSCLTDGSGQCSITKNVNRNRSSATLTVDDVSSGTDTYETGDNHDPDGGDGTTIVVTKP